MEEGGCVAWLLIIVTGVALVFYEGKRVLMAMMPYWPVVEVVGVVALTCGAVLVVLWLLWLVGHWLWEITEPGRQRRRTVRQIAKAQAEIRAIRSRAVRQMQRTARRNGRG